MQGTTDVTTSSTIKPLRESQISFVWKRLLRSPGGLFGVVVVLGFLLMAIFGPYVMPHDPLDQNLRYRLTPPFWVDGGTLAFPLGTDALGRDLLSRIIIGTRVSLLVGVASVALGATIGALFGVIAGYFGKWVDDLIMRIGDVQLAFPSLILAIAVMAVLGPGLGNIIIVLGFTNWVEYARVVRSKTMSIREQEYISAAQSVGSPAFRTIRKHVLPNAISPIIVVATFAVAQAIIAESSLSFLGIGIAPPTPTWGNMVAEARDYVGSAWWLPLWPGLAIMICLLGINLLGDWLRDLLDPKLKN